MAVARTSLAPGWLLSRFFLLRNLDLRVAYPTGSKLLPVWGSVHQQLPSATCITQDLWGNTSLSSSRSTLSHSVECTLLSMGQGQLLLTLPQLF